MKFSQTKTNLSLWKEMFSILAVLVFMLISPKEIIEDQYAVLAYVAVFGISFTGFDLMLRAWTFLKAKIG